MATRRTTFGKQERERAKRTKAAAKRDRRLEKDTEGAEGGDAATPSPGERNPQFVAQLMDQLERLHRQFEAHELGYEEFEEKKVLLLAQLPID